MSTPDWEAIRADYVANGLSYRELGKKYGVHYATISRRAQKDGWLQQSATICNTVRNTVDTEIVEKKTDQLLSTVQSAEMMDAVIRRVIGHYYAVADEDPDKIDVRKIESLAKSLALNTTTLTGLKGIPTQAQRHAQRLAEERLAMERDRLEMDKRKADQDAHPEEVRIVIEGPEGVTVDA